MNSRRRIAGWTLSETLVMMIVSGIVFLAVMDGFSLFIRYSRTQTAQIVANSRLYEGYYRLEHLTASADSARVEEGTIMLFRDGDDFARLSETDSMLIVFMGTSVDTLMPGIHSLTLAEYPPDAFADTLMLVAVEPAGAGLRLSFPIERPPQERIIHELHEKEKQYAYE